jgi:hypothetical protein
MDSMILRLQERNPLNMCHFFPINPNELEVVIIGGEYKFKIRQQKLSLPVIFENGCDACVFNFGEKKKVPHFSRDHRCEKDVSAGKAYISKFVAKRIIPLRKNFCIECGKKGHYHFKGNDFGIYCFSHKLPNMVDIRLFCQKKKCKIQPTQGYYWMKPTRCFNHQLKEMENVVSKKCKTFMCDIQIRNNKKYEGYCFKCFCLNFPKKLNARNYKIKEISVVEFIRNKFPKLNWIYNDSSGKRPNLLCDLGHQIIIIEVDENRHLPYYKKDKGNYCSCENKRMLQISQDFNHKPIIFIHFNPDKYTSSSHYENKDVRYKQKKISGCWKLNINGLRIIKDKQKWQNRLNVLADSVSTWIDKKIKGTFLEIFLFYNGFYA